MSRFRTWNERRKSNRKLRKAAWKALWARDSSREKRKAAAFMFGSMFLAGATGLHLEPSEKLKKLSGGFKYGEYCGVGHGVPQGETDDPIDELDAACEDHDEEQS